MAEFEIFRPLIGGMAIGLASAVLMIAKGRIAGISGIVEGVIRPKSGDTLWRIIFIAGLLVGGLSMFLLMPDRFALDGARPITTTAIAGLLVGFGVHIGCGCTSGHGVCGISRISLRSLVAVPCFMVSGALVVWLYQLTGGQ
ncbi:MAG: YeeE/YedE thiosulfate transporter family protein [Kangiellaceae bacterium]|jgi:uncharacterized membrane protein YedE/YeeE|nr:YeeE/YedE thiosulfate transporter family protein [Kangiellaceae bacterium]